MFYSFLQDIPDPSGIVQQALDNSDRITSAVILLLVVVLVVVPLILLAIRLTGSNQVNPDLIKLANTQSERVDKEWEWREKLVGTMETISKTMTVTAGAVEITTAALTNLPALMRETVSSALLDTLPKIAREELTLFQERLRLDPVRIGIMSVANSGRILAVNQDALDMFGWKAEDVLGRFIFTTDLNVIGADQQKLTPAQYVSSQALTSHQKITNRLVGVYNSKIQDWVWVVVNAEPVFDPDTSIVTRIFTTYIEAGRVIQFDPNAEYAKALSDTAEIAPLKLSAESSD